MADNPISLLAENTSPASNDLIATVDVSDTTQSANGTNKKMLMSKLLLAANNLSDLANTGTARTNLELGTGALASASPIQCGRLTLTTGVPVTTTDVTAASTIYYTPHIGDVISLYDGTTWTPQVFTELSRTLGSLTSGKNYDVVVYLNSGTLTLDLMPAWTDDTTRASAISLQNGVYVNTSSFTSVRAGHSVSAGRAIVVGTIRTTGTSTTEDAVAKRFCANSRNTVKKLLYRTSSTNHTYSSTTVRPWNNDSTMCVEWVNCFGHNTNTFHLLGRLSIPATGSSWAQTGMATVSNGCWVTIGGYGINLQSGVSWTLAAPDTGPGYRIVYITQYATGSGNTTYYFATAQSELLA